MVSSLTQRPGVRGQSVCHRDIRWLDIPEPKHWRLPGVLDDPADYLSHHWLLRCVEDIDAPRGNRFMFVIPQDDTSFFVLTTTNI
jgi:hypothetical protein